MAEQRETGPGRARAPIRMRRLYDSARDAVPAGLRSMTRSTRHLLYRADTISLHMQVERDPGSADLQLVGQVADLEEPVRPLVALALELVSDNRVVGTAESNDLGEFTMQCGTTGWVRLRSILDDERRIEVVFDTDVDPNPVG